MFFFVFYPPKKMRQPFSGMAEWIFMKLFLPNDTGENGVCKVVTPPGECRAAARLANVDDLRNLRRLWSNHQRAPRTVVVL